MSTMHTATHTHFLQLAETLTGAWHAMTADSVSSGLPPMQAYLLLNRWTDNALAEAITDAFPEMAKDRCAVPDAHYRHEEDRAPCLVQLPQALATGPMAGMLAQWLASAWQQVERRHTRQDFCAVVFGHVRAATISAHWVNLGHQRPPDGTEARLLRYQDPRVMQRVWPLLTPAQHTAWLGPVVQWWSLTQPWGPWQSTPPEGAHWFRATVPKLTARMPAVSLRALLDPVQWHAAHLSPAANRVWAGYAAAKVPLEAQPDGATVSRLLADGQRLGLTGPNLIDYAWCSWRHDAAPGEARLTAWEAPPASNDLARVLQAQGLQPEARFASLYLEALKQRRG